MRLHRAATASGFTGCKGLGFGMAWGLVFTFFQGFVFLSIGVLQLPDGVPKTAEDRACTSRFGTLEGFMVQPFKAFRV